MGSEMPNEDLFYRRFFFRVFLGPILGLVVGSSVLLAYWLIEGVDPRDRVSVIKICCGVGTFAGLVIGVFWAFSATKTPPGGWQ
jgi:hypothetical protein